jgi:hypothetical protein
LLAKTERKEILLGEEFFDRFHDYFLIVKKRMDSCEDLYKCINFFLLIKVIRKSKIDNLLEFYCPPLDAENDGLQKISLLCTYYFKHLLYVEYDLSTKQMLQKLVQYTLRMYERFQDQEVARASRDLVHVCMEYKQMALVQSVDLVSSLDELREKANSLIAGVHLKHIQKGYQEKNIKDIKYDLFACFEYYTRTKQAESTFFIDELMKALELSKELNNLNLITTDLIAAVVAMINQDNASQSLFLLLISVIHWLLKKEDVSDEVLLFVRFAYNCPWPEFAFGVFNSMFMDFQIKIQKQNFVSTKYTLVQSELTFDRVFDKIFENFNSSNLEEIGILYENILHDYINSIYFLHLCVPNHPRCKVMFLTSLEKIGRERKDFWPDCKQGLLEKFPEDVSNLKKFFQEVEDSLARKV